MRANYYKTRTIRNDSAELGMCTDSLETLDDRYSHAHNPLTFHSKLT
jgi:hypothetical protein